MTGKGLAHSRLLAPNRTNGGSRSRGGRGQAFPGILEELLLPLQSKDAPASLIAPGEPHSRLRPEWNTALPARPLGGVAKAFRT